MVVHEIQFTDMFGRVALTEFLRLAGLVAAGAADAGDLAQEFATNEVTLTLDPDEFRCTTSYDWYLASFEAYKSWMAADEVRNHEDRARAVAGAVERYRDLIEDAARHMNDLAGKTAVPVFTVPVTRHLRVVR